MSIEIDLVVVWVVEIDFFQCGGWNLTSFLWRDEIDLVVVWVVEIDLISA